MELLDRVGHGSIFCKLLIKMAGKYLTQRLMLQLEDTKDTTPEENTVFGPMD